MGDLYLNYLVNVMTSNDDKWNNTRQTALNEAIRRAAVLGDWEDMVREIGMLYGESSSIRNAIGGEYDVQGFVRGLLCLNRYYAIWPELELGYGYSDILLLPNHSHKCPTKYSYLIEIKRMKADNKDVQAKVDEAIGQLRDYAQDKHLSESRLLRGTQLRMLYIVLQRNMIVASALVE